MFKQILYFFGEYLVRRIGYVPTVRVKDTILFLSGITLGSIIMIFIVGRFFYKVKSVEHLNKMTLVKLCCGQSTYYVTNAKSFSEAVEVLITLAVLSVFNGKKGKDYRLGNMRRTKVILCLMCIFATLLILLGVLFVLTPLLVYQLPPQ